LGSVDILRYGEVVTFQNRVKLKLLWGLRNRLWLKLDWYDLRGWRWMSAKRSSLLSAPVDCVLADAWFDSEMNSGPVYGLSTIRPEPAGKAARTLNGLYVLFSPTENQVARRTLEDQSATPLFIASRPA
jgi:hypothetical protein